MLSPEQILAMGAGLGWSAPTLGNYDKFGPVAKVFRPKKQKSELESQRAMIAAEEKRLRRAQRYLK